MHFTRAQTLEIRDKVIARAKELNLPNGVLECVSCGRRVPSGPLCLRCGNPLFYIAPESPEYLKAVQKSKRVARDRVARLER